MGQDGEDGKGDDPDVTVEPPGRRQPEVFEEEIRTAVRYERGLAVKALAVLAVLAVIVVLRTLYFALPAIWAERAGRWGNGESGYGCDRPPRP